MMKTEAIEAIFDLVTMLVDMSEQWHAKHEPTYIKSNVRAKIESARAELGELKALGALPEKAVECLREWEFFTREDSDSCIFTQTFKYPPFLYWQHVRKRHAEVFAALLEDRLPVVEERSPSIEESFKTLKLSLMDSILLQNRHGLIQVCPKDETVYEFDTRDQTARFICDQRAKIEAKHAAQQVVCFVCGGVITGDIAKCDGQIKVKHKMFVECIAELKEQKELAEKRIAELEESLKLCK